MVHEKYRAPRKREEAALLTLAAENGLGPSTRGVLIIGLFFSGRLKSQVRHWRKNNWRKFSSTG